MNVRCPTCGADVEFRYDDSFVRVCGSCRAAVVRTDRGIETLGRLADLVPIESPLRLFAEGRFGSTSFLLIGMAQLRHAAGGIWQEWYAKLDGGQWAWLSEAQGRFYLTFEKPGVAVPQFAVLTPGQTIQLDGRAFTVAERGIASYASANGEIPYRLDPTAQFQFADLADGRGGFATIDYGDHGVAGGRDEPTVYIGYQVSLQDLGIFGGEVLTQDTRSAQGAKLACPSCGGSLELRAPDQTLRVACPYCNHLVSVQTGNLSVIAKLSSKATPRISLGTKGKFVDGELVVIGYLMRAALVDGTWYPFEEYLLYAPQVGFRWLVSSDNHWSYVQPVAPGAVEVMPVRYGGVTFELFARVDLRVEQVLGEFYWQVAAGERVAAEDYIAPPAMLSCETTKQEQSWSLSTYMKPKDVQAAFGNANLGLGAPVGVGANQPYPLHGVGKVAAIVVAALCVAGIVNCQTAKSELKHSQRFEIAGKPRTALGATPPSEVPATITFSEKFTLAANQNIEVQLATSLSDNWLYAAVDLVNEQTGGLVSFDKNLEYYSGFTDGESWSEGSETASQVLAPMEAGEYVLRVEAITGAERGTYLSVTVKQGVFRARWFLGALIVLAIPFGLVALHAFSFKKRRWENASPIRSYEAPDGGDDD